MYNLLKFLLITISAYYCIANDTNYLKVTTVGERDNFKNAVYAARLKIKPYLSEIKLRSAIAFFDSYNFDKAILETIEEKSNIKKMESSYEEKRKSEIMAIFGGKFEKMRAMKIAELEKVGTIQYLKNVESYYENASKQRIELFKSVINKLSVNQNNIAEFYSEVIMMTFKNEIILTPILMKEEIKTTLLEESLKNTIYRMRDFSKDDLEKILNIIGREHGDQEVSREKIVKIRKVLKDKIKNDLANYIKNNYTAI